MPDLTKRLERLGVWVPSLLLPRKGCDLAKWAVVACDQYSSERDYWDRVDTFVGDAPSALRLIFPECYLEEGGKADRIAEIQRSMRAYLDGGVLEPKIPGFALVERSTPFSAIPRKGLVIAVDLEAYSYAPGSRSLIRPTEGTILERLPPRMEIRRGAALELPHIMLLVDDPGRTVIEPLHARFPSFEPLYDFELMGGAGRLRGSLVSDEADLERVATALESLAASDRAVGGQGAAAGGTDTAKPLLFAVGDGNHSLATAKAVWEEIKAAARGSSASEMPTASAKLATGIPAGLEAHPARYALVELVNVYDEGLPFHPIHRALFKADEAALLSRIEAAGGAFEPMPWRDAVARVRSSGLASTGESGPGEAHLFAFLSKERSGLISFASPTAKLAAGTIQPILDAYLASDRAAAIDYIHGEESLEALARKPGNLGLYLPPIDKAGFFATVIRDGIMPRKTFSMGEAPEKRFYVEARRIG